MIQKFLVTRGRSLPQAVLSLAILFSGWMICQPLDAQVQPELNTRHYMYDYEMPPGMIAHRKLLARQSMVGYFQPVRLIGPQGAQIDVFSEGSFQGAQPDATTAGLMVGHIYRLKITNIPGYPGRELYPSVEIIGRLFPPEGQEVRFAIPVKIPLDDLEPAMEGNLVTRVVYLENPRTAMAEQRSRDDQPFFDIGLHEDPVRVAEKFGRPMVIVRIGSRVPDVEELNAFGFGTPPMMWFESALNEPALPHAITDPFQPTDGLEIIPSTIEDGYGLRDSSVRQVTYLEPVEPQEQAETSGQPVATPLRPLQTSTSPLRPVQDQVVQESAPSLVAPGSPLIQEAPQSWSLDDAGVQNNTGLTDSGLVQDAIDSPAMPEIVMQGEVVVQDDACLTGPVEWHAPFETAVQFQLPPWPDEMLIDGGDRNLKSIVSDQGNRWEVRGLDSEDTIGHFDTMDGRRIVDASNRVAIYAPRFSAVRKVDGLGRTQYTNEIGRIDEEMAASASSRTDFSSTTLQNIQPSRHRRSMPASGLESRTRGVVVENPTRISGLQGKFKTYENLRLVKTGFYDNREKGRLSIAIQRANNWNSTVSAQSTTLGTKLVVVNDVKEAQETVHIETEFNRPQLRLVKIASTDNALPGDYVDFTIRFDNVGDQPIGNVTILDNLTGRLDYVEDTAECSLECNFSTAPNESGSQTLKWEIDKPLATTKGGVIRFRCRVR